MNAFELFAKLTLDTSGFDSGLEKAKSMGSAVGGGLKTAMDIGLKAVAGATAAVGAFGAASVKTGMEFDSSMSQVAATMGQKANEMVEYDGQMMKSSEALREFALKEGRETAFSASQAADALNYMALAGYDANTSIQMLPNVLNLAAAGNFDLARASDMVTDTQSAFGISLERTTQMVDEMARASSTGNTSVEQLGDAFLTVGGLAQELNGGFVYLNDGTEVAVDGIQELEIALTAMANSGIKGSEAGTHMRNMLLKLSSPTSEGTKALEAMGVSVFDTEGKMRSLADVFVDLGNELDNMSQEEKIQTISDLFNTRDLASAEALLGAVQQDWDKIGESILSASEAGVMYQGKIYSMEEAQAKFGDAIYDTDKGFRVLGAAEVMAATQLDNLKGDMTLFGSALEGTQIALSDKLTPAFRGFVQDATTGLSQIAESITKGDWDGAVNAFSQFMEKMLQRIVDGLPKVIEAGMKVLGALGQGMLNNIPVILDAASQVLTMFLQGIVNAVPSLLDGAAQIIAGLGTFLIENAPTLMESAVQLVINLANFIAQNADKTIEGVIALIVAINEAFYKNIPQIIPAIVEMVAQIALAIITHIPDVIVAIVRLYSDMIQAIWESKDQFFDTVSNILVMILNTIIEYGTQMLANVGQFLTQLLTDTNQGMSDTFNKIVEWLTQIPPKMAYYAGYAVGEFIKFVAELPSKASEIFQNVITKTVEFLTDFVNKAVQGAKDFFDAIVNGLKDLPSRMAQFGRDLVDAIKDLPDKFLDIGGNIVKGLWKGISDGWSWLEKQVSNLVDSLIEGVEDALGIASPSKVFKKIGYWVDAGFGEGISNNSKLITKPMQDIADSLISIPNIDAFDASLEIGENTNIPMTRSGEMGYTQVINITSPTALSPYEVARQTRNATRDMVLSMRKG